MTQLDVSFPMYNLPEMASAYQALWDALVYEMQKEGVTGLPPALNFKRPPAPNAIGPEVYVSRTCGYPLQTIFSGQYELLGVALSKGHKACATLSESEEPHGDLGRTRS